MPDRLAIVWESRPDENRNVANPANYMDWKEQNSVFTDLAGFADRRAVLIGDGEPEEVSVQLATPICFQFWELNRCLVARFQRRRPTESTGLRNGGRYYAVVGISVVVDVDMGGP